MSRVFADDDLTEDGFLGGRLRIAQPAKGYRAATDPVLLAAAVPARNGESVLELGCGVGVASLCLGARVENLALTGLEVQENYATLARRNAEANRIEFEVIVGDLRMLPTGLRSRSFDHVIANPPFFSPNNGTPATDPGRELAQRESTPLQEWVSTGLRRLKPGGRMTMIHLTDRLPEILSALCGGAGTISVLPIAARSGRSAGRVIVTARKGGRGGFRLCAPFILHEGAEHKRDGDDYSSAARAVLRNGCAITS